MRWAVLVDDEPWPEDGTWRIGQTVEADLQWVNDPETWGQDDLSAVAVTAEFDVEIATAGDARIRAGALTAMWLGPTDVSPGRGPLSGVLLHDRYLSHFAHTIPTTGVVAAIDMVATDYFHDAGHWIALAGSTRLERVGSCDARNLVDETMRHREPTAEDLANGRWYAGTRADYRVMSIADYEQRFPTRLEPHTARRARWFRVQLDVSDLTSRPTTPA